MAAHCRSLACARDDNLYWDNYIDPDFDSDCLSDENCRWYEGPLAKKSRAAFVARRFIRTLRLVREGKVQSRRELQIVLFRATGRVADIDVGKRILPSEPLVDLGHGTEVERSAILAGMG